MRNKLKQLWEQVGGWHMLREENSWLPNLLQELDPQTPESDTAGTTASARLHTRRSISEKNVFWSHSRLREAWQVPPR